MFEIYEQSKSSIQSRERKRVLVLAPHTDDGELGCGGSIVRFIEEGKEIFYVAFASVGRDIEGDENVLKRECERATTTLGIPKSNLILLDYPIREFLSYRQKILDEMINFLKLIKPDIVLLPSIHDTHQDHQVIAQEGFRAFKKITCLGYELPWNNLTFTTQCFVKLEERHIQKKIEAISYYESQRNREYVSPEFIKSLARTRGVQIGVKYAEVFEIVRWVL
jgi:LmbE family N-acetylglucosaminyl deacetylase